MAKYSFPAFKIIHLSNMDIITESEENYIGTSEYDQTETKDLKEKYADYSF